MAFIFFKSGEELWNLAFDYLSGSNGKSRDYAEAAKLFEKARKSGYKRKGYGPLAYLYYNGLGVEKDPKKAFDLCLIDINNSREISKWGLQTSQYYLAFCYLEGKGTTKNTATAATLFKASADNGHLESHYRYAKLVYKPVGTDMNAFFTARKYMKVAFKGVLSLSASIRENVKKKYHEWFEVLSDEDCKGMRSSAIHQRAYDFQYGNSPYPKDEEESERWYRKAVSMYRNEIATDKTSAYNYALCLYLGHGTAEDKVLAKKMLQKAIAMGDTDAVDQLYKWYPEEKEKEMLSEADAADAPLETLIRTAVHFYDNQNYESAIKYAKKAIEKYNSSDGWAIYGAVSEFGLNPYKKDIYAAAKWYLEAAKCDSKPIEPKLRFLICDFMFKTIVKDDPIYSLHIDNFDSSVYMPYLGKFTAMCIDDGYTAAYRIRGVILYANNDIDNAYADLYKAYSSTKDIYAAKYLGFIHYSDGKYNDHKKAVYYLKEVIDIGFGTRKTLGDICEIVVKCIPGHTQEFRTYLTKGSDYGNGCCKFMLAGYMALGEAGFWRDIQKAKKLFRELVNDPEYGESAAKFLRQL